MMKKNRPKSPAVPLERHDTVRHAILAALADGPHTAQELSAACSIPEKEVYDHLEHIGKTVVHEGRRLVMVPSECRKCGFVFRKRERLKKPGRCPVCRGSSIRDPRYVIPL